MPIRFASSLLALLAVLHGPAAAQDVGQDPALVDALAQVLAVEDARRWDAPVLTSAARHPVPAVRRRAALAMGRIGNPAALTPLVELLGDPDAAVAQHAAFALGILGDSGAVAPLRELALGEAPEVGLEGGETPAAAVSALARIGGPAAADAYRELLSRHVGRASTAEVPVTIARAVADAWRLGPRAPVGLLVEYTISPVRVIKIGAIYSLARLRAPEGAGVLLGGVDSPEPEVRLYAVRALTAAYADSAGLDRGALATRVRRLVGDQESAVRVNALRSLATFRDSSVVPTVVDRLTDQDLNVRVQAAATLGDLGGARARAALHTLVDRDPFALRRRAVIELARLEAEASLDVVAPWVTDRDWTVRHAAAEALGYVTADTVVPWLVHLTRDADGRVAAAALTSLVAIAPETAGRRARDLVAHEDPVVRAVAVDRLAAAPDTADIDRLARSWERAVADPIPDARIGVVVALGRIAGLGFTERIAVEDRFLARVRRPDDYLVRRAAVEQFPLAAERWGAARPIETGRALEDYRDIARRLILPAELEGRVPRLVIETSQGRIDIDLNAADAPVTVNALLELVDERYFDAGRWHRVVPNFVVQDGDPRGDGWGGPGFALRDEVSPVPYDAGTVGMALSGPDTGGSQFFITHSPQPHLDGTYPVIGRVVSGMEVVRLITQGDRIRRVRRP